MLFDNAVYYRDMRKEAGWKIDQDVHPRIKSVEDYKRFFIHDIDEHPDLEERWYYGDRIVTHARRLGGLGQRDAEFILKHQGCGGYGGLPREEIHKHPKGYYGQLIFAGTVWAHPVPEGALYIPCLVWGGLDWFMAFYPTCASWNPYEMRRPGLPLLKEK